MERHYDPILRQGYVGLIVPRDEGRYQIDVLSIAGDKQIGGVFADKDALVTMGVPEAIAENPKIFGGLEGVLVELQFTPRVLDIGTDVNDLEKIPQSYLPIYSLSRKEEVKTDFQHGPTKRKEVESLIHTSAMREGNPHYYFSFALSDAEYDMLAGLPARAILEVQMKFKLE